MNLWIDDERKAPEGWLHAWNYHEALMYLSPGDIEWASFDHDLGLAKTGYDIALHLAEYGGWPTEGIIVHSMNPVGAKNICGVVDRYGPYHKPTRWEPAHMVAVAFR